MKQCKKCKDKSFLNSLLCNCNPHKYCIAIISVLVAALIIISLGYPNLLKTRGVAATWNQSDWSVGASSGSTTTNQTGWGQFDSSSNIDYSSTAGQLTLNSALNAWTSGGVRATETTPIAGLAPRSVASGTGVIVVFIDTTTSPTTLRAQKMNTDGTRAWPAVGTENGVIIDQGAGISTSQIPKIVSDDDSGAIIVWESGTTLYAQKVDTDGVLQWDSDGVTVGNQPIQISTIACSGDDFDITSDSAGGVNIVWKTAAAGIYGQRIDTAGTVYSGWDSDGYQLVVAGSLISVADDGNTDNGFYFGYNNGGGHWVIETRDGDGNVPATWDDLTPITIDVANTSLPIIIPDGVGGVVTSLDYNDDIYVQRVDNTGTQLWNSGNPVQITSSTDADTKSQITLLGDGGVGITWSWKLFGGSNATRNIYLQKIKLTDGLTFGGSWTVNDAPHGGTKLLSSNANVSIPSIAQDGSGGAYVFWYNAALYGQRIDSDGGIHDGGLWVANGTNFGSLNSETNPFFINYSANANKDLFVSFINTSVYVQKIPDTPAHASSGSLTSSIFDATEQMTWDTFDWTADIPTGTSLSFEVRSAVDDPSTNIATEGTASATSSCTAGTCGFDSPVIGANDGATGSLFTNSWAAAWTGTVWDGVDGRPAPQDLTISFTGSKTISKIELNTTTVESGNAAPTDFTIDTYTTAGGWVTKKVESDLSYNVASYSYTFSEPVEAEAVKIHITGVGAVMEGDTYAVIVSEFYIYEGAWSCDFGDTCTSTSVSGASGSIDLSTLAEPIPDGQYLQYKATFTATDTTYTPTLTDVSAYIVSLSSAKAITAFNFSALDPAVTGVINGTNIALTVPYGNPVTALVPTIAVSDLATVSPLSGVAHNFTTPQTYTVTAEDTTTQAYTVTVYVGLAPPSYIDPNTLKEEPFPPEPLPIETPPEEVSNPSICSLENIQFSPIPDFNSEWGVGYPGGRIAWALEHRANIYQAYLDILGRCPTAIEVNWWLQESDDIWLIRWLFLTSEEYLSKHP